MNYKKSANFKPSCTHFKILDAVNSLNENHFYPSNDGVYKILKGVIDEETTSFQQIKSFGTIISYSSKKVSRYILMLLRYEYLVKIFDRKTNSLYLRISDFGKEELQKYLKKYQGSFKKKTIKKTPTIVKIG